MKPWRAILAALLIFGAGAGSGFLFARIYHQRHPGPAPASAEAPGLPPTAGRFEFMRRWVSRLDLAPDQRERIEQHLHEAQQRVRELWQPVAPQVQEELKRVRKLIEAELSPDQRTRFEAMSKERSARSAADRRRRLGSTNAPFARTNAPAAP